MAIGQHISADVHIFSDDSFDKVAPAFDFRLDIRNDDAVFHGKTKFTST